MKNNATAVQELAAKRMQLLGQLESAKMQESVNKAVDSMTATVGADAPSLEEVENKIQARMAQASAKAELTEATSPDAAIAELKAATTDLKASAALDDLPRRAGPRRPPRSCPRQPRPTPGTPADHLRLSHRGIPPLRQPGRQRPTGDRSAGERWAGLRRQGAPNPPNAHRWPPMGVSGRAWRGERLPKPRDAADDARRGRPRRTGQAAAW